MYRVLITDGIDKEAAKNLKESGYEVVEKYYEFSELCEEIKNFDVIVVRSATKINRKVIDSAVNGGKLKLVIRGGVGVDNIDVNYAKSKGIRVMNTPKASSISVAELTIAHMFAISRYVYLSNVTMREGKWEKKKYKGIELNGKTLGLIGFGRIAREVAKRAYALGMKVIYTDILGEVKEYDNYSFCSFDELLKQSDFISLHVPYDKTKPAIIGKEQFEIMKEGVYVINCARGGVVDEDAMLEGLNSGKVAGACMDVFKEEPARNEELVNNPRVCVTPHIGASTVEAQKRIGKEIVGIIENYFVTYEKNII